MFAARRFRLLGQLAGGGLRLGASLFSGTRLAARRAPESPNSKLAAEILAQAKEATRKAKAEADAAVETAKLGKWRGALSRGAILLGAGFLALDWLSHWKPFVRARMKWVISAGPTSLPAPVPDELLLDVQQPALFSNRSFLILGPSGSGKSTLMASLARKHAHEGRAVVYYSTRSAYEHQRQEGATPAESALAFQEAARSFCAAIGYPESPSLWDRFSITSFSITWDSGFQVSAAPAVVKHFSNAIRELFSVFVELKAKTGITPVLYLDEFHDFMSDRLHNVGGKDVFILIADAMLKHCVDKGEVAVVMAASGSELIDSLEDVSKGKGDRVSAFFTSEPSVDSVQQQLRKVGFSEEDVKAIVATCGVRLRTLRPFLTARESGKGSGAMVTDMDSPLDTKVALAAISAAAEHAVQKLLDRSAAASCSEQLTALLGQLEHGEPVKMGKLPAELKAPFPSTVLFRGERGKLMFQTEAIKQAWIKLKPGASPTGP